MPYIIIVFLTFIQTLWMISGMDFPIGEWSPYTLRLWCNYLVAPMVLFCPLLFTSKRRWTYIVSLLLDVWFIGNLVYYRSYGDVLNRWCLESAGNMNGLWSSIIPFIHATDIIFVVITAGWIVLSELVNMPPIFSSVGKRIGVTIACMMLFCIPQSITSRKTETPIFPFATYYDDVSMGRMWYIYTYGPLAHLCNECINQVRDHESAPQPVTQEELAPFVQAPGIQPVNCGNMLFVLFESLEDWTIGLKIGETEVTPSLNRLVAHRMTGCYPMYAQVQQGKSSDARLIAYNGLLPIYNGATAMRYASNTYPSWVKHLPAATKQCFTSSPIHIWNQERNTYAYGFDSLYAGSVSDAVLANAVLHSIQTAPRPFMLATYTMASHAPFIEYADSISLPLCKDYSDEKMRYLRCVHYTDSVLGVLIDAIMEDSELASTTRIVITGDHPIFAMNAPVPFIIYDPFESPAKAGRALYQLDIYTTITDRLHLSTPWRGLGKNISDTCAYKPEQMRELEILSDRLIRTDFFKKGLN